MKSPPLELSSRRGMCLHREGRIADGTILGFLHVIPLGLQHEPDIEGATIVRACEGIPDAVTTQPAEIG